MDQEPLKFVIVGHVDHGKSTLIGRLLFDTNSLPSDRYGELKKISRSANIEDETEFAYLLDHLDEERQQGITIETTQVTVKTSDRDYILIDAPGHVEFVKNMLTGASQAEAAILLVDAAEGTQEQTKRHACILSLLDLRQIIVGINKMDLVDYREEQFNALCDEMKDFLDSIGRRASFFIPLCARSGENVVTRPNNFSWYDGPTVLEALKSFHSRPSNEALPLLFPVQDVYKIDEKRIGVGRIESGVLRAGQEVKILPSGRMTKVRTIEKFFQTPESSRAGESVGITTDNVAFVQRGDVLCAREGEPHVEDCFQASLIWLSKKDFHKKDKITLRCATQEVSCHIEKITRRIDSGTLQMIDEDAEELKNLQIGEVVIRTKRPIVFKKFHEVQELGRFVLVEDENICAGGIIT